MRQIYETAGLPFWSGEQITFRDHCINTIKGCVERSLLSLNRAWTFERCEGPILTNMSRLSGSYGSDDVFMLQQRIASGDFCLRPETTPSSYAYALSLMGTGKRYTPPLCVWQAGKSFRVEANDGASASKMRFNEFWQLEFQCIFAQGTKADYREALVPRLAQCLNTLTGDNGYSLVDSDRLPSYSTRTQDIELLCPISDRWVEACSVSDRIDFDECFVLEAAIGLDRLVLLSRTGVSDAS